MAKPSMVNFKKSLLKQLKERGSNAEHFYSFVEDICYFEQMERKMQTNVRKNGSTYQEPSDRGYLITKANPCVKFAKEYNTQKMAIVREMGLTVDNDYNGDDTL